MTFKSTFTFFALMGAVFASAQAGNPAAVHGRGQTINQDGQRAAFTVHAVRNGQNEIRANFAFITRAENPNRTISIRLAEPARFNVAGKTGALTGRAVLTVEVGQRKESFNGQVVVRVEDIRQSDLAITESDALPGLDFRIDSVQSSDRRPARDRISVQFMSPQTDRSFDYRGSVAHGDIKVRAGN